MRRDHDDRHLLVDQRDGTMLHLAGGIALGMDIGDFLQLQRAFQRQREALPTPHIKYVGSLGDFGAQHRHLVFLLQKLRDMARRFQERGAEAFLVGFIELAARLPGRDGEGGQRRQLAGEGLGRSHADFRSRVSRQHDIGFAGDGAFRHIHHRDGDLALGLGVTQRRQSVGSLARLRHEQRRAVLRIHRIAIAQFGGDIGFHRQPGQLLEPVFADHARIIGGTAGGDCETRGACERGAQADAAMTHGRPRRIEIMGQGVTHHFGLFVDFLGHEMIVTALVHQRGGGRGDPDFAVGGTPLRIENRYLRAPDHRHIAVFQIGNAIGERRQREGVGTEIGFSFGITHSHRCALARADQKTFMILEDHGDGISAGETRHRRLGGRVRHHALVEIVGDQMGGHFAVGLGFEFVAAPDQFLAQLAEILDDAVMDDGDPRRCVRMGVGFGGRAMRRPPRVADAGLAGKRGFPQHRFQLRQFAGRTAALDPAAHQGGDAGGIIAAIFQPLQRFQDDGRRLRGSCDADDAAH